MKVEGEGRGKGGGVGEGGEVGSRRGGGREGQWEGGGVYVIRETQLYFYYSDIKAFFLFFFLYMIQILFLHSWTNICSSYYFSVQCLSCAGQKSFFSSLCMRKETTWYLTRPRFLKNLIYAIIVFILSRLRFLLALGCT